MRASPSTRSGRSTWRCPAASRRWPRPSRRSRCSGDPGMSFEDAARRRDFTINAIGFGSADRRLPRSLRRSRATSQRRLLRVVDRRTFGDDSLRVLRAVQFAARFELAIDPRPRALCRAHPARRSAGRTHLGRDREAAPAGRAGPRSASRSRSTCSSSIALFPEMHALVGCAQEPDWHPEGDVWVHTLMVIDDAAASAIDDSTAARRAGDHARRRLPRLRQARDDGVHRRPHPLVRTTRRPAFTPALRVPRSPQRAHRSTASTSAGRSSASRRSTSSRACGTRSATQVGDGAFRRLAQKVDLELLARLARADCHGPRPGEFDCSAMDWFVERARSLGVEHKPPAPLLLGRHVLALGARPRTARRPDPEARLRTPDGRRSDDARRGDRRRAGHPRPRRVAQLLLVET